MYYVSVANLTNLDDEHMRVGVEWIQSNYVAKQKLKVRIA